MRLRRRSDRSRELAPVTGHVSFREPVLHNTPARGTAVCSQLGAVGGLARRSAPRLLGMGSRCPRLV